MKNKKKIASVFLILIITFLIFSNLDSIRHFLRKNLSSNFKNYLKELVFSKEYLNEIYLFKKINYNQKLLPKTQFENINFKKIEIDKIKDLVGDDKGKNKYFSGYKFFVSLLQNNLMIITSNGHIQLFENFNFSNIRKINSNLKSFNIYDILDIEIIKNNLYISFASRQNDDPKCLSIQLVQAAINTKELNFKNFYKINECINGEAAGRIVHYYLNGSEGILFSTGAVQKEAYLAQDNNSLYGKILFVDFNTQNAKIISKGHRNPQGLLVDKEIILSTEHGPYGGDEINRIILNGNYGWPISSYGENYNYSSKILNDRNDYVFKKRHSDYQYIEPIYSFVPSIGISEIIKVPDNFSKYWKNNYLITSLNGRSLYRVLFDENYSKLIFSEKIPIGERIRDIKYNHQMNSFILALEETGSIGILKVN